MPSVVTSRWFQEYEDKKELVKIKAEELKAERKRKREEKNSGLAITYKQKCNKKKL